MVTRATLKIEFLGKYPTNRRSEITTVTLDQDDIMIGRGPNRAQFDGNNRLIDASLIQKVGHRINIAQWDADKITITGTISEEHVYLKWDDKIKKFRAYNKGRNGTVMGNAVRDTIILMPGTEIKIPAKEPVLIFTISY